MFYTQDEINGISTKDLQDKIFTEKFENWNDLDEWMRRGTATISQGRHFMHEGELKEYFTDVETPIFTQDRDFINRFVYSEQDGEK
ncbi:hypothetical protein D3C71_1586000 [compost metagenome]